eukprot:2668699-Prymnesium_polylepis.1
MVCILHGVLSTAERGTVFARGDINRSRKGRRLASRGELADVMRVYIRADTMLTYLIRPKGV